MPLIDPKAMSVFLQAGADARRAHAVSITTALMAGTNNTRGGPRTLAMVNERERQARLQLQASAKKTKMTRQHRRHLARKGL